MPRKQIGDLAKQAGFGLMEFAKPYTELLAHFQVNHDPAADHQYDQEEGQRGQPEDIDHDRNNQQK